MPRHSAEQAHRVDPLDTLGSFSGRHPSWLLSREDRFSQREVAVRKQIKGELNSGIFSLPSPQGKET